MQPELELSSVILDELFAYILSSLDIILPTKMPTVPTHLIKRLTWRTTTRPNANSNVPMFDGLVGPRSVAPTRDLLPINIPKCRTGVHLFFYCLPSFFLCLSILYISLSIFLPLTLCI